MLQPKARAEAGVTRRYRTGRERPTPGWHGDGVTSRTPPLARRPSPVPQEVTAPVVPEQRNDTDLHRPGSAGEHALQCAYGTRDRADRFYADQVRDRLLPAMVEFVGRMEMLFVSTADATGECDATLRAGPPGFVRVVDDRTLAYPEYRGNGVHASLGNIAENGHVGLLMVDFMQDLIGLHVNGGARIVTDDDLHAAYPHLSRDAAQARPTERWVVVDVDEAYIHCRKHVPHLQRATTRRPWGTDHPARKGGDYFAAKGTPARVTSQPRPRRRFPATTHLAGGSARTLRPRRDG